MGLRIEYLLMFVVALLLFSIVNINPSSKEAITTKADKEIRFENFVLLELQEGLGEQKISALDTIKYHDRLELKEINMTNIEGDNIVATQALYQLENEVVHMKENIKFTQFNGFSFSTKNLDYDIKNEEIHTIGSFVLELNESTIEGTNLIYSMNRKEIRADNIHAKIFVSSH